MTNDEIIEIRDLLLAKNTTAVLSVHEQNLLRDCDIALGVVRCELETRDQARARITRLSQDR